MDKSPCSVNPQASNIEVQKQYVLLIEPLEDPGSLQEEVMEREIAIRER